MDANGSRRKSLTDLVPGEFSAGPSVCGDGRHVIAVSNHGGTPGLFRIDADGTNLVQLTSGTSPSCSPDGKWVIFESNRMGKPTLWKVPVEGGEQKQLTTEECFSPAILPDGAWIACLYAPESSNGAEKLAILPAAGGNLTKTFELKGGTSQLRWTPDGHSVTYAVGDGMAYNLWNQAMGGGPPRRITNFDTGGILTFAWSRDGKWLAVASGSRSRIVGRITPGDHGISVPTHNIRDELQRINSQRI
jgi:Tol biopolymer transport system component